MRVRSSRSLTFCVFIKAFATDGLFNRDTPELALSEFQEEVLDAWKRPAEALPPPLWFPGDRTNLGPSMAFARKIDLVQDAATDCSVVASLCAAVARVERGHPKIMRSILHPFDDEKGQPLVSPNGKYIAKLNFNGCFRKVVIDDRLPVSSTGRVIHVMDRQTPGLLWPALLEKAYLKVRGGYDFPGSNSATDLWILTGWIPEQVFLQSEDLEPERLWDEMLHSLDCGDVLITMGTGKMTSETERALGLAAEHDYAVLDLREVNGQRLLMIKNPWCEGPSWRGKIKESTRAHLQPNSALSDLSDLESDRDADPVESSRDLLNADSQLSPGTFWMDLDNVIQHFESIYLNWNPSMFKYRQDIHFAWDLSRSGMRRRGLSRHRYSSLKSNPQFAVNAIEGGTIWVLLWRHLKNAIPEDATEDEIAEGRFSIDMRGHISLAAFSANGHAVLLPDKPLQKGWFVDSPQTLLKLTDCAPGTVHTIVPLEQELAGIEHTLTLTVFSDSRTTLTEATKKYPYARKVVSAWTKETAGGNAHSPAYVSNPQFVLTVPAKTGISLLLEAANEELNIHVKLVHSNGKRVHSVRARDIVFDSNDYRRACCLAENRELEPGQYTVICSTYDVGQLGEFALTVDSAVPTEIKPLPREGAGRLRLELSRATFKPGESKVAVPLVPRRLVRLYAVARALGSAVRKGSTGNGSLVRMTVESGRGPTRRIFIASNVGQYADAAGDVRTEDLDLYPEMVRRGEALWLVLDRVAGSAGTREESFHVELYVDQPDALDSGVWRGWDD